MQLLMVPTVIRPLAEGSRVSGSWKTAMVIFCVLGVVVEPEVELQASSREARPPPVRAMPAPAPRRPPNWRLVGLARPDGFVHRAFDIGVLLSPDQVYADDGGEYSMKQMDGPLRLS